MVCVVGNFFSQYVVFVFFLKIIFLEEQESLQLVLLDLVLCLYFERQKKKREHNKIIK